MTESNNVHRAKKSLGQNFLQDQNICRRIVEAIAPQKSDFIIEIGPGQGALTSFIKSNNPTKFMVLELDDELASRLESKYPDIEVVRTDALKYSWESLAHLGPCKIIGNLPYNVGSKLIWDIVSQVTSLQHAVFMVQHEVALRLTATPGNKAYGGLTAWVNNFANTRYLFKVPPTVFRPRPKVDSAVVSFTPLPRSQWPANPTNLSLLIKMLFQKRRKQLSTILKKHWSEEVDLWFENEKVKPEARPETLTPQQFLGLSQCVCIKKS
ncbi:16S rRNA (adenine(1518)-N(6)/adenine(1519)-N(6))-dimethyltransferase RsmA [Pseudodesulfovibrio piezophilus]|uniref:Ribosomal RNA small subunit methyltransferase A n=1 Tax=Pseudodesulfovibrio piezophilus (strain DSM 21447 / JCM 15486 / C1TLV30) TaxID=1322246 RepID=M1WLF3_PSEP2|nr:16S rRNA (adenine(1518)-N(6)/adenine(1519)-N(6))-dimethyltransferase RsmA [Pseudodesulfovibrio piezophilus]CCH47765.1 Ribosomal RNA small subunit methyltransferase A [Pseudodesulfovibrio piezophilus C1TLV30]